MAPAPVLVSSAFESSGFAMSAGPTSSFVDVPSFKRTAQPPLSFSSTPAPPPVEEISLPAEHTPTTSVSPSSTTKTTTTPDFAFDSMSDALASFKAGEFLLVMDDERRENEGDLIIAADSITTEKMAWFIRVTSGYVCISLPGETLDRLELPLMVANNTEHFKTAYTITVDYAHGTTTGISAHDRALTARKLAEGAPASDFSRPGHMVPLRARDGGVLARKGHTESAVDLCRITGHAPAGLLCELVNDDAQGTMARRDDCRAFANKHGIKMISVDMIAQYLQQQQQQNGNGNANVSA